MINHLSEVFIVLKSKRYENFVKLKFGNTANDKKSQGTKNEFDYGPLNRPSFRLPIGSWKALVVPLKNELVVVYFFSQFFSQGQKIIH